VTPKTASPWTVIPTERFSLQIANAFAMLDDCVRKNQSLQNRERYLKQITVLKAFKNFALREAVRGPDKSFIEIPKKGTIPTFHIRQVGSWTGYCSIDRTKNAIRWDFATHDGKLC
jgi:hypothetical protein